MVPFSHSLLLVALAEMGDKTQLLTLTFGARFSGRTVLLAIGGATLLLNAIAAVIGAELGNLVPRFWTGIAAGIVFLLFGLWALLVPGGTTSPDAALAGAGDPVARPASAGATAPVVPAWLRRFGRAGPALTIGSAFFLAEFGDKSTLATAALANHYQAFLPVWLGASLGMFAADGAAVLVGEAIGRRVRARVVRYAAGALFLASGIITLAEVFV